MVLNVSSCNVSQSKRFILTALSGTILLIIMLITDLSIGSVDIPFSSIISILIGNDAENQVFQDIIIDIRLPKSLTAILAGAGLSLGGLLTQTLFRNPLAGPDVLGL